eukprot:Gb_14873 [translate_table: standard]
MVKGASGRGTAWEGALGVVTSWKSGVGQPVAILCHGRRLELGFDHSIAGESVADAGFSSIHWANMENGAAEHVNGEPRPVGEIPENANERSDRTENRKAGLRLFFPAVECPGPEAESAGKVDACEGCPNQQICATAPKGPDPGTFLV